MIDPIKELEGLGLLEQVESHDNPKGLRKYIYIILPHLLLVSAVCGYAFVGAVIFHSIESPNEDALKANGIEGINKMRGELIDITWQQREELLLTPRDVNSPEMMRIRDAWVVKVAEHLQKFNEQLYRAYKEEYVRYGDVTMTTRMHLLDPRFKRHWFSKTWTEKRSKMWTWSSALFFAATTMATIGYGNIVPVTVSGKIACFIFALIGAPLTIITIGDLGKFLSECTIWFYTTLQKILKRVKKSFKIWRMRNSRIIMNFSDDDETKDSHDDDRNWEDEFEREDVPVLFVFAILLLYMAFGGVLFAVLESWTYIDAFYYSFVSLTTIGFGDLVPDRHEYIVITLIYLGVGLAVTTMCIDLVGIQYIHKIHYFGRKFQNADLFQLLKRKRLIERHLAFGQSVDVAYIIQKIVKEGQKSKNHENIPISVQECMLPPLKLASQYWVPSIEEEKYSIQSDQSQVTLCNINETVMDELSLFKVNRTSPLTLLSGPSFQRSFIESTPFNNFSANAHSVIYRNWFYSERGGFSLKSGIPLSLHCSLKTSPSVTGRKRMYKKCKSLRPSVNSFFELGIYRTRIYSAPASLGDSLSTSDKDLTSIASSSMTGIGCIKQWDTNTQMVEKANRSRTSPSTTPSEMSLSLPEKSVPPSVVNSPSPVVSALTSELSPVYKVLSSPSFPNVSLESERELFLDTEHEMKKKPVPEPILVPVVIAKSESEQKSELELKPESLLSTPSSKFPSSLFPPIPIHDFYPQVDFESPFLIKIAPPSLDVPVMQQIILDVEQRMYAETIKQPTPVKATAEFFSIMIPNSSNNNNNNNFVGPVLSNGNTVSSVLDIGLGAFELVDNDILAETLLSHDNPVIYHKNMPVHSVHHDTVQTEVALENLMNAPSSMLSNTVPPAMVADNYCFIVDGNKICMNDIMGDDQWWKHTSRLTKYFYFDDLKNFYRATVITAKGKIISAQVATGKGGTGAGSSLPLHSRSSISGMSNSSVSIHNMPSPSQSGHSIAASPRVSICADTTTSASTKGHRKEKVALTQVYKVIRVYSFWKTCTSFHRIVTMIDTVTPDDNHNNAIFKKRLFVQYLWRNATSYEKARVQREFNPQKQRLLRVLTDDNQKKKTAKSLGAKAPIATNVPIPKRQTPVSSESTSVRGGRSKLSRTLTVASDGTALSRSGKSLFNYRTTPGINSKRSSH